MQRGLVQSLSPKLSGAQRRELRGLAHGLNPIVNVGMAGVTDAVIAQVNQALYDHELIKVKVIGTYDGDIEDVATSLTRATQAACVQQIGHILVFYKANPDDPKIVLTAHPLNETGKRTNS
ncbi:MAG: ribosome assembly RNA-binding protein YhbY [Proteobacteria bacterium]|nr:ribosome assembly RNA-binding protein YhbY [Pseudomonadota bacterium]